MTRILFFFINLHAYVNYSTLISILNILLFLLHYFWDTNESVMNIPVNSIHQVKPIYFKYYLLTKIVYITSPGTFTWTCSCNAYLFYQGPVWKCDKPRGNHIIRPSVHLNFVHKHFFCGTITQSVYIVQILYKILHSIWKKPINFEIIHFCLSVCI